MMSRVHLVDDYELPLSQQVTVELQEMLGRPLMGPEGDAWKQAPRQMPESFEAWVDAQIHSQEASNKFANYKDIVHPLEMSKKKHVLDNMWKYVNLVSLSIILQQTLINRLGRTTRRSPV